MPETVVAVEVQKEEEIDLTIYRDDVCSNVLWVIFQNDNDSNKKDLAQEAIKEAIEIGYPDLLKGEGFDEDVATPQIMKKMEKEVACYLGDVNSLRLEEEMAPIAEQIVSCVEKQLGKLQCRRGRKRKENTNEPEPKL